MHSAMTGKITWHRLSNDKVTKELQVMMKCTWRSARATVTPEGEVKF